MPSSTIGRFKLYPKEDPRHAFYPALSVAGALPSMATQTFCFTSPRPRCFAVAAARGAGRGRLSSAGALGSQASGTTVTTASSSQSSGSGGRGDPAAAAAAAASHVAAVVKAEEEVPPYTVVVAGAGVFASKRSYAADCVDQYGFKVLSVKMAASRRGLRYDVFDQVNMCSTKGMPKMLPVFSLTDASVPGGALVDATLCKQGKPVLHLRVEKPVGGDGDSVWTGRDPATGAEVLIISDFIAQPGVAPSVTVRACPPFSIDLPLTCCLWAMLFDLYSRKAGVKARR
jgi:hypothetical protein